MATTELKSCLKKPGASRRDVPPISFCSDVRVVGSDNQLSTIPLSERKGRKKSEPKALEPSEGEDDLTVDVSKYLVKSIYDSSSEEEEAESTSPTSKKASKKDSKADRKEKKEKQRAQKASRKAKSADTPFPGVALHEEVRAKRKLSLSERFRRKKKLKSQLKGVKVLCAPKELSDAVIRLALPPDERLDAEDNLVPLKETIMEGFAQLKLQDMPGKPTNCRFTMSGNGVIDCYHTSMADGVIEFLYFSSLIPLFIAHLDRSEEFLNLEAGDHHGSDTLCMEGFTSPRSADIDEDAWIPPDIEQRKRILILFSSSSDRAKFLAVVSPFFIDSPYQQSHLQPKKNHRQASVRNIGRVLRNKKNKLGGSEPRTAPFPGIALHLEPGKGGTDRPFRMDSAPDSLTDKLQSPRGEGRISASISDPELHEIQPVTSDEEERPGSPTAKSKRPKKKKRVRKEGKASDGQPSNSPRADETPSRD